MEELVARQSKSAKAAEQNVADSELQARAVMDWAWLSQARQEYRNCADCTALLAGLALALRQGHQAVQKWDHEWGA